MYYVIKGPADCGQYLCDMAGHACPQWWHDRGAGLSFKTAEDAWRHLEEVQRAHRDDGTYTGRVVRVWTTLDQRARLAQYRADNAQLRATVIALEKSLREFRTAAAKAKP